MLPTTSISEPLYFRQLRLQVKCETVNYDFMIIISKNFFLIFFFWFQSNITAAICTEKLLLRENCKKSIFVKNLFIWRFLPIFWLRLRNTGTNTRNVPRIRNLETDLITNVKGTLHFNINLGSKVSLDPP